MRRTTPHRFSDAFYAGIDTNAQVGDEMLGFSIGRFYVGIYPTHTGYDVSVGILNEHGCLE